MKKPSRFSIEKTSQTICSNQMFKRIKLNQRYYFSEALQRIQNWNLHIGTDTNTIDEIIIVSALDQQKNIQSDHKKISQVCSKLLFEGGRCVKNIKYKFKVYEKTGCMLWEFLSYFETISIKTFQLISVLLIELLIKIEKMNANIKTLDEKILQIVIDPTTNSLRIQICHPNIIQFRIQRKLFPRHSLTSQLLQKNNSTLPSSKKKMSYFLQNVNSQPSNLKDIHIVYQKILSIFFTYKILQDKNSTKENFLTEIKTVVKRVMKSIQNKEKPSTWIQILRQYINKKSPNLKNEQKQAKITIQKIKEKNHIKSSNLCQSMMTKKAIQEDESEEFSDGEFSSLEESNEQQIQKNIADHTLITNLLASLRYQN